jgi:hypothetical protein
MHYAVDLAISLQGKGPEVMPAVLYSECMDMLYNEQAWDALDRLYAHRERTPLHDSSNHTSTTNSTTTTTTTNNNSSRSDSISNSNSQGVGGRDFDDRLNMLVTSGTLDLRGEISSRGMTSAIVRRALQEIRADFKRRSYTPVGWIGS